MTSSRLPNCGELLRSRFLEALADHVELFGRVGGGLRRALPERSRGARRERERRGERGSNFGFSWCASGLIECVVESPRAGPGRPSGARSVRFLQEKREVNYGLLTVKDELTWRY